MTATHEVRYRPALERRHPSGVVKLDDALAQCGPVTGLCFLHDADVDPTPFLDQALDAHLAAGGTALLLLTRRSPAQALADSTRLGIDPDRFRTGVHILDLRSPGALGEVHPQLLKALQLDATAAVVVESLTPLMDRYGEAELRSAWADWAKEWASRWTIAACRQPTLDPRSRVAFGENAAFIRLASQDVRGVRYDSFYIEHPVRSRRFHYLVERPGGIRAHYRKILVTGPHDGGKSAFVRTISARSINVEHLGTTVSLDHGQLVRDGIVLDVYGTPGQERFDPIIQDAAQGALGIILLVDSTRPQTFPRARQLLAQTRALEGPFVVGANKQDQEGAATPEEVRKALGLEAGATVLPCVGTDAARAMPLVDALVERIQRDGAGSA